MPLTDRSNLTGNFSFISNIHSLLNVTVWLDSMEISEMKVKDNWVKNLLWFPEINSCSQLRINNSIYESFPNCQYFASAKDILSDFVLNTD